VPASFDEIGQPRRGVWKIIQRRNGKFLLAAEAVALFGWLVPVGAWLVCLFVMF
jgi:hypothetical protein